MIGIEGIHHWTANREEDRVWCANAHREGGGNSEEREKGRDMCEQINIRNVDARAMSEQWRAREGMITAEINERAKGMPHTIGLGIGK